MVITPLEVNCLEFTQPNCAQVHLIVGVCIDYVSGGEMFTHLYQRDHFSEDEVRIYVGEIVLALEHLHKVRHLASAHIICFT